jgi:XRN 5'-3' exonuclease N-terminus
MGALRMQPTAEMWVMVWLRLHATYVRCTPSRSPRAGIPKFYRWLSERYPLLNMPVTATDAPPEIDNLYLDMNGIIHNCTHANDPTLKLTETEMVVRIFAYLDKLIQIMKPRRLVFLAIDGVRQVAYGHVMPCMCTCSPARSLHRGHHALAASVLLIMRLLLLFMIMMPLALLRTLLTPAACRNCCCCL